MKKLLLLEDGPTDVEVYKHAIRKYDPSITLEACVDLASARAFLASSGVYKVAVAIIDGNVPEGNRDPSISTSTVPFVRWMREKYPKLVLIAAAGDKGRNDELAAAGCQLVLGRKALSQNFGEILYKAFHDKLVAL